MYRILGADGREYGPVTAEQLRGWITEGRANAETRTRTESGTEWRPLAQTPEFSFLFAATRIQPPMYGLPRKTNSLAVAGFVLGILSLTGGLCCYGIPCVLGVIFSIAGLSQIHSHPEIYDGKGIAIAGLLLSLLGLAIMIGLIFFVTLASSFHEPIHHFRQL